MEMVMVVTPDADVE